MVTDRYQHVRHHETIEEFVAWAAGRRSAGDRHRQPARRRGRWRPATLPRALRAAVRPGGAGPVRAGPRRLRPAATRSPSTARPGRSTPAWPAGSPCTPGSARTPVRRRTDPRTVPNRTFRLDVPAVRGDGGDVSVAVSCPRCGGPVRPPDLMHTDWRCVRCGPVPPLHVPEHIGAEIVGERGGPDRRDRADAAGDADVVPVAAAARLDAHRRGWAGDDRTGVRATAVACSGPGAARRRPGRLVLRGRGAGRRPGHPARRPDRPGPGPGFVDALTDPGRAPRARRTGQGPGRRAPDSTVVGEVADGSKRVRRRGSGNVAVCDSLAGECGLPARGRRRAARPDRVDCRPSSCTAHRPRTCPGGLDNWPPGLTENGRRYSLYDTTLIL